MGNYREQLQEERKDIKARFIKLVEFIKRTGREEWHERGGINGCCYVIIK